MAKVPVQIRMAEKGLIQLDKASKEYGVPRTDVIRACLTVAFRHWVEVVALLKVQRESL